MNFLGADIPMNKFIETLENSISWYGDNYINNVIGHVMTVFGDEQLRFFPYYFHFVAEVAYQDFLAATGNLDANL